MPGMGDPRFYRSVIFICEHNDQGAMGLIINQSLLNLDFGQLLSQLGIEPVAGIPLAIPILTGGPVETGRGFLLHTLDFRQPETMEVEGRFGVTGTVDALKAVASAQGPKEMLFMLGYAGWGAGQLEREIQDNAWMIGEADYEILFNTSPEEKWDRAMGRIGIDPVMLSPLAGRA